MEDKKIGTEQNKVRVAVVKTRNTTNNGLYAHMENKILMIMMKLLFT